MPTVIRESEPYAQLEIVAGVRCSGCGDERQVAGEALVPVADLRLRLLEDLGELPIPLPGCEHCGAALEVTRGRSIYRPDEPELPRLSCEAILEDGEIVSRYQLLHADAPPEDLVVGDEEELAAAWGRPLSVRERLLGILRMAGDAPQEPVRAALGPGLSATAVDFGRVPDPHHEGDQQEVGALMRRCLPDVEATGISAPAMVLASSYRGPGEVSEWAGPFADRMRAGRLMLFVLIDTALADERLAALARSQGARPIPFSLEEIPESLREHRSALAEHRWFEADGDRLSLESDAVGWTAAGRGHTLAEAAVIALGDKVAQAHRLGRLLGSLREAYPDVPIQAPAFSTVIMGEPESGRASVINLEGLARRFAADEDLLAHIGSMHGRFQERRLVCECGQGWHLGQLRAPDDPLLETGVLVSDEVSDARGQRFALVATAECPHEISYLHPGAGVPEDLERVLADGTRKARLVMSGALVRALGGRGVGAILRGPRIASALAHPSLAAALLTAVRQRGLGGPLVAQAPTTDVLILCRAQSDALERCETAFIEARRAWGELPGSPLGFVSLMSETEPVGGRITVRWDDAPNRATRRARR